MPRYEITDLQCCELEELPRPAGIRITVTEERDSMGFPRVTISGDDRDRLLDFVRENWGDDEDTGGWYSEYVLPQVS